MNISFGNCGRFFSLLSVIAMIAIAGCEESESNRGKSRGSRGEGSSSSARSSQANAAEVLNDAADILETIKDDQSLEAAKPRMEEVGKRLEPLKSVIVTAVYLGGMAPGIPPQMRRMMKDQVRNNPEFAPYLAEGEGLAKNREFQRAYSRYNRAFRSATRRQAAWRPILEKLKIHKDP